MKISFPGSENGIANVNTQNKQLRQHQAASVNSSDTFSSVKPNNLSLEQSISNMLQGLTASIQTRENLINSLPSRLKEATLDIIKNTAAAEKLIDGLGALASSQKAASEQLLKLVTSIKYAQLFKGDIAFDLSQSQAFDHLWVSLLKSDAALSRMLANNDFSLLFTYINETVELKQFLITTFRKTLPDENSIKELLALIAKTAPENLTRIAEKNKLPELVMLWSCNKFSSALPWLDLNSQQAQKACDILQQIASSLQTYAAGGDETGATAPNQKLFSLSLPLYFENNPNPYPAYIHVYQDTGDEGRPSGKQAHETWLRVCLSTENLGIVDSVFRLYQENLISIRVAFSSDIAAGAFTEYLPEIENQLSSSTLKLTDIKVK